MSKSVNPVPFQNYFGGKSGAGVYQSIINHIPPHRLFVIPFAGNCGAFKNMRQSEWVIINDLDNDVFEAWYHTGVTINGGVTLFNNNALDLLDWIATDRQYSRWLKHTFIYLDPPYLDSARKGQQQVYKCHFGGPDQHIELLHRLLLLPPEINVMISHYPCELYDSILQGWYTFDFQAKTQKGMATERIYMNYQPGSELHDYSYIGEDFRERERHKRIMVNFFAKLDKMEPLLRNKILQQYELNHQNERNIRITK